MISARDSLVDYLRHQLVGPAQAPDESLGDSPSYLYTMGVLFPRGIPMELVVDEEEVDEQAQSSPATFREGLPDDPVTLAHQWLPASMGISFFIEGNGELTCEVWGAAYGRDEEPGSRTWKRTPLAEEGSPEHVALDRDHRESQVLDGRAVLTGRWRKLDRGWLVTVALVNTAQQERPTLHDASGCLFQVGFTCRARLGRILEYPGRGGLATTEEEEELRVLYRRRRTYAIGHGCAATWDAGLGEPEWLTADVLPTVLVPDVTHGVSDLSVLSLSELATDDWTDVPAKLDAFVDQYRDWIDAQLLDAGDIHSGLESARDRILERLKEAEGRMRDGVRLLESDPQVRAAFRIANLAMLMQMRHMRDDLAGRTHPSSEPRDLPTSDEYLGGGSRWRPFQLAFMLLTLPSIADTSAADRSLVDLLWFPTGGGKTEAYLALIATTIALRRLRHAERSGGTSVITRYTLRLLTSQQFQRAASLICALRTSSAGGE